MLYIGGLYSNDNFLSIKKIRFIKNLHVGEDTAF